MKECRLYLFVLITNVLLISCNHTNTRLGMINNGDTTCIREVRRAEFDIKKGKLVYCHYAGNIIFNSLRSRKEMAALLKRYKIDFLSVGSSCVVYENQTEHCYCKVMEAEIEEKFGNKFSDSLLNIADIKYVKDNIDSTFYYGECDVTPGYPGDSTDSSGEYSDVLQKELAKMIEYPEGYVKRKNDNAAFTDITFEVRKNGEATVKSFYFVFDIKSNHKFEKYFEAQILKYVRTTAWNPATIRGYKVNSDMVFRFQFL